MFLKDGLKLDKHIFFNFQDDLKTLTLENSFGPMQIRIIGERNREGTGKRGGEFCIKSGCWVDCRSVSGERVFKEVITVK